MDVLAEIQAFLGCETPESWIDMAKDPAQLQLLLTDHAHCEKKAASTAMTLMFRYVDHLDLLDKMSRLAREELVHFEKVLGIMKRRKLKYGSLSASRYAGGMHTLVRRDEPDRLIDTLIVGAFIEARSCERFAKLAPYLDEELQKFYLSLLKSEGRHYQDYLHLAQSYANCSIEDRIALFRKRENELVLEEDSEFRFHSGVPAQSLLAKAS